MSGKQLTLATVVAALVLATSGSWTGAAAQSAAEPGVNYADSPKTRVWLRVDRSLNMIAVFELPWSVAPHRCSNRKGYSSMLFTGYENGDSIDIAPEGTFRETVVDRYRDRGSRFHERQIIAGTITDESAFGTIRGRVKIVKPNGLVVRCTLGRRPGESPTSSQPA